MDIHLCVILFAETWNHIHCAANQQGWCYLHRCVCNLGIPKLPLKRDIMMMNEWIMDAKRRILFSSIFRQDYLEHFRRKHCWLPASDIFCHNSSRLQVSSSILIQTMGLSCFRAICPSLENCCMIRFNHSMLTLPSGKHTKSYWKWWFIVDLPIFAH